MCAPFLEPSIASTDDRSNHPAVCARYGLRIGAKAAPFVLALMYLEFPIAYPIAKLLDRLLGEEQGVTYKKAELKTFVGLHKRESASDRGQASCN